MIRKPTDERGGEESFALGRGRAGETAIQQRPVKLLRRTHGFLPVQLPEEMRFVELINAEDERIPIDPLECGTRAIQRLLERMERAP